MHLLFVYGTLKQGRGNSRRLEDARFVGEAETVGRRFIMWDVGFPMVAEAKAGHRVAGEAYLVDDATLANCDRLEGHPHFYARRRVMIKINGRIRPAWMYLRPAFCRNEELAEPCDGLLSWPTPLREERWID